MPDASPDLTPTPTAQPPQGTGPTPSAVGQPQPAPSPQGPVPAAQAAAPGLQSPPPAPMPTPAQISTAKKVQEHHSLLGGMVTALMGKQVDSIDPTTGEITYKRETPGTYLRGILAGALLGGAAGLKEGHGVIGGITAGGAAGMQSRDDADKERMEAAQNKFKIAQSAVKEQRERQTFTSEQEERKAITARAQLETIKVQQELRDHDYNQMQQESELGKAKVGMYREAGIDPLATGVTHDQMTAIVKANPRVVHWDWEQTGVKTVMVKDAQGNMVPDRVPTFEAFDSDRKVTVNEGFLKLLKDAKLDDVLPGTTERLKVGTELTPAQFQTLKMHYDAKHAQDLHDETVAAANGEKTAAARKDDAEALAAGQRAARDKATAANLNSKPFVAYQQSLKAWDAAGDSEEGFSKLGKQDKMNITNMLPKVMDEERKIIDSASKEFPPDQATMDSYKSLLDYNGRLLKIALKGTAGTNLPKPPKPGAPITADVIERYKAAHPDDPAGAKQAMKDDGWGPPAPPAQRTSAEIKATQAQAVEDRRQTVVEGFKALGRSVLGGGPVIP